MNRKTKIIVSITGITLIGLMLLGLTYGYFVTKINGNTNAKSISVTSAKKIVEYTDLSEEISGKIIEPGYEAIKLFTVKNIGTVSATYHIYLDNVVNEFIRTQDITYTLYRKDGNNTININSLSSSDIVASGFLPKTNNYILINETIETPNDYYTYALKINYINSEENQDEDQGHTFSFKVQLHSEIVNSFETGTLAYSILDNSMKKTNGTEFAMTPKTNVAELPGGVHIADEADSFYGWHSNISYGATKDEALDWRFSPSGSSDIEICSAVIGKHLAFKDITGMKYIGKVEDCTSDGKPLIAGLNDNILSIDLDDYGLSYYYRGNVEDNYVNFAGMCWRIVRIVGDGSVKLILEDQDNTCTTSDGNWNIPTTTGGSVKTGNFGYTEYASKKLTASDGTQNSNTEYIMDYLNGSTDKSSSMATAFKNFQTGPLSNYLSYLKLGDWCLSDKAYATTNSDASFLTNTEILDSKIKGEDVYYDSFVRLYGTTKKSTLKCNGTLLAKFSDDNMYVGTLTADELVYAGGTMDTGNVNYYLLNSYQKNNSLEFLSLSPFAFSADYDFAIFMSENGRLLQNNVDYGFSFRPAITLLTSTQITGGNGLKTNPYIIK